MGYEGGGHRGQSGSVAPPESRDSRRHHKIVTVIVGEKVVKSLRRKAYVLFCPTF